MPLEFSRKGWEGEILRNFLGGVCAVGLAAVAGFGTLAALDEGGAPRRLVMQIYDRTEGFSVRSYAWLTGLFQSPPKFVRSLTEAERLAIEREIRDVLIDPDSARFKYQRGVPMPPIINDRGEERILYCLEVNSKNRMGGYVGDRTAIVILDYTGGKFESVSSAAVAPSPDTNNLAELDAAAAIYEGCQAAVLAYASTVIEEGKWRAEHGLEPVVARPTIEKE